MKTRTICIILSCLFLIGGIALSLSYRSNLKNVDLSDENLAHFKVSMSMSEKGEEQQNPDADKIVNDAEAIFYVRATGKKTMTRDNVIEEVVIEDVIKSYGDLKTGDSVYIFEAASFTITTNRELDRIYFNTVSNMMQKDERYIVFLKFFKRPDGYKYSDTEKRMFLLTDKNFAVISPDREPDYVVIRSDDGDKIYYEDVRDVRCLVTYESMFEAYKTIRKALLEKINYR